MTTHHLPLQFSLDADSVPDTLEAVLATARRGGLQLATLTVDGTVAALTVSAADPDRLDLFLARLHQLIGVAGIVIDPARPAQKVARMHVA